MKFNELDLNLGLVGYKDERHPFRVSLDAEPLAMMLSDAANAYRVYELMLVERPGDLWDYVQVTPIQVPPNLGERIERARSAAEKSQADCPWPEGKVPFCAFDKLFHWAWDDTDPEDEAWLDARSGPQLRSYAGELLASLVVARGNLAGSPLLAHELSLIRAGTHRIAILSRAKSIEEARHHPPSAPRHTDAFYASLEESLKNGGITSVAYRGDGDYRVLKLLCEEQLERASKSGQEPGAALEILALVNRQANTRAWGAEVWFYSEGLGDGDLYIDGGSMGGSTVKELVEEHFRLRSSKYILSQSDEGDISGFRRRVRDGYCLYQRN